MLGDTYRYQLTLSRRPRAVSLECPQFSGYKRRRPLIYTCENGWATPSQGKAVGLSWQQGPLLPGAIGRFLVPEPLPKRLLWAETLRRRRAEDFGGNREKAPDQPVVVRKILKLLEREGLVAFRQGRQAASVSDTP